MLREEEPGNGFAIAAGSLETELLVGKLGVVVLATGRSIGTIGKRFIGTILDTRSSRSLQRPAEVVLGNGGLDGSSDVFGVAAGTGLVPVPCVDPAPPVAGTPGLNVEEGGGGKEGATDEAGSRAAPLVGGRTKPLVLGWVALGNEAPDCKLVAGASPGVDALGCAGK